MSDNGETTESLAAERDRLQAEVALLKVARDSGVPVSMLGNAATEEAARALADQALAWRAETPPKPQTTAVSPHNGVGQISRETLGYLSPDQINQVYREGRLSGIGAPAPPSRRTGEQHRNAAP